MVTRSGSNEAATSDADRVAADLTENLANSQLDLEALLTGALGFLSKARRGTWVGLVMKSDPSKSLVVTADHYNSRMASHIDGYLASLDRHRTLPTMGMSQQVIDSGKPKLIASAPLAALFVHVSAAARAWHDANPEPVAVDTVSSVIVPMRAFGQIMGTLQLVEWNPRNPMTDADVGWMQTIADRLGVLVEHAQCHAAASVRLDRLTAVRNVSLAIASSQDLRLTLHLVLEQVKSRLDVDAADLLQVDPTSTELYTSASVGFHAGWVGDVRVPVTTELADAAASGRRFELHSDHTWLGTGRRSLFAREGFAAYRAVPLMARSRLLGVLEAFARADLNVDEEWVGFLHAMAISAAVAIDNANLHEQIERGSGPIRAMVQRPELSAMEWRILALVVEGATNREIATGVHLSENTIKFHIRRLLDRVGAVNRTDLARKATQNSWL